MFAQSHDWRALYENFPFKEKAKDKKSLENHGVNTAMALKYGGVRHRLSGDAKDKVAIFSMLEILDRYHGQATGIFTCDEHLAGRSPSQGTELCTVVEAMYSLEVVAAIIGDARLGDRLEMLAYQCTAGDVQEGHDGPPVRPAVQPGGLYGRGRACLREQRGRLESLWTRAELRLLHGKHAPRLAQICEPPVDEKCRRRACGHRVCPVRDRNDRWLVNPCASRSVRNQVIHSATNVNLEL